MINCLTSGIKKFTENPVIKKKKQGQDENTTVFQGWLIQAFKKYTNMDYSSLKEQALLAMHFIAQSAPDIRHKIKKKTAGPQTIYEWFTPTGLSGFQ